MHDRDSHLRILMSLPALGLIAVAGFACAEASTARGQSINAATKTSNGRTVRLTDAHVAAVNRQRRVILQMDVGAGAFYNEAVGPDQLADVIDYHVSPMDELAHQIDSIWWDWTEGNSASWPSEILPRQTAIFPRWSEAGIDPVRVLLEEARKRGREVFFSYRVNGNDNGPGEFKLVRPMKEQHPERLIEAVYPFPHYWNFVFPEVRELKRNVVREIAAMYAFDGIQLDFARMPIVFPPGEQWHNRKHLTDFIRSVRMALLEIAETRGRPMLLAVRVPATPMGCHFDGYDVETWIRDRLVDILVLGNRSADVDLAGFKRITQGTGIKCYPSWDDYHASDGYRNAPIEVFRGVAANWWHQGADGIHLFNIGSPSPAARERINTRKVEGFSEEYLDQTLAQWQRQVEIFHDVGSMERIRHRDKAFIVQRRGDHLGPPAWPKPTEWETPRHMYFGSNMLAQLPAALSREDKGDTLLVLTVADDTAAAANQIVQITLRIVLSDLGAEALPADDRLEPTVVGNYTRPDPSPTAMNKPPEKGIEARIECRLNNLLLPRAVVERGWLVFPVAPEQLAVGRNLLGLHLTQPGAVGRIILERVELHIRYRQ